MAKLYRLMFFGGASQSSHNQSFSSAAINVADDWKKADKKTTIPIEIRQIRIQSGASIVETINGFPKKSLLSIDIFAHGDTNGTWFAHVVERCYIFFPCAEKQNLYKSGFDRSNDGAGSRSASWDDVNYVVFTDDARIEFHGCNAAPEPTESSMAGYVSKKLYLAGKKKAYVIGHGDKSNPNRPLTAEEQKLHRAKKLNLSTVNDYRNGLRRVLHNSKVIYKSHPVGHIGHDFVEKLIP